MYSVVLYGRLLLTSLREFYRAGRQVYTDQSCRNIIEKRYGLTERDASIKGSYLLAGSVALYPVVCVIVHIDRTTVC